MSRYPTNTTPNLTAGEYAAIRQPDGAYLITKDGAPPARVTEGVIEAALKRAYETEF